MKKLKYILFLMTLCALLGASEFTAALDLQRGAVRLGEYIQLVLSSSRPVDKIDYPQIPGAQWAKNIQSSGTRYINGKTSYMKTLYLAPEKEGEFTIPPFRVYAADSSVQTREIKCRVLPRRSQITEEGKSYRLSDVVKGTVVITPRNRSIYAGEEMTVTCDLLVDERFTNQVRLSYYPEFSNVSDALFTTWEVRSGMRINAE